MSSDSDSTPRKQNRRAVGGGAAGCFIEQGGLADARLAPHKTVALDPACWMLFDLGLDPAVVADKLGHADPHFTFRRYIGIRDNPDTATMPITDHW